MNFFLVFLYLCIVLKKRNTMPQIRSKDIATYQFPLTGTILDPKKSEYDEILEPDDDLRSAITAEQLIKELHQYIDKMFAENE